MLVQLAERRSAVETVWLLARLLEFDQRGECPFTMGAPQLFVVALVLPIIFLGRNDSNSKWSQFRALKDHLKDHHFK